MLTTKYIVDKWNNMCTKSISNILLIYKYIHTYI